MTAWMAAVLVSASLGQSPGELIDQGEGVPPARQARLWRDGVSELLRLEATTTGGENAAAIRQLVALHGELAGADVLSEAERNRLRQIIRSRLIRVAKRIEAEEKQAERASARPARIGDRPEGFSDYLGQALGNMGQQMARGAGRNEAGEALLDLIKTTIKPDSWDDRGGRGRAALFGRFGSLSETWNEASTLVAEHVPRGAFGGGAAADHGPELVELIQTVIAPNSWDVNGGPGTIYYYRNLRVLVIRQTGEGHRNVGGLLGDLRDAGN